MPKPQNNTLPSLTSLQDVVSAVLNRDPIHFAENTRTVKGDKFRIINTGRDYLREVYNYICFELLKPTRKPVVVVKGRQVEFTETMLNVCLYYLYHQKHLTILYGWPSNEQVSRFSSDRFDGAIKESQNEFLKKMFLSDGKQNVHHKQFKNSNQIYMYSAWAQADTLRGVTCDVFIKDEVQDWTTAAIQNTQEALTQSKYKIDLALGTPKSEGTYYYKIWQESDQRYFHVCCTKCSHFFKITMDVCKKGTLIECPECRHVQEKKDAIIKGKWIPTVKDPDKALRVGFHLSQLLHPNITIEDILRKKRDYGERRFRNEVLGEFTGSLDRPLSPQDIMDMVMAEGWNEKELWDYPISVSPPEQTVMGIDWGGHSDEKQRGSYNALVIVKPLSATQYQIVYSQKLNFPEVKRQIEEIKTLAYRYNCQQIVADHGYGHVQVQMLQEEFGSRVTSCMYQPNLKSQYKYDPVTNMLSVDKDFALEELFQEIQRKQWIIPVISSGTTADDPADAEADKYEWLIHHICNIEIKDIFRVGNTRKSYQKINRPCDGLHALNYCRLALIIKGHIIKQQASSIGSYAPMPVLARFGRRM